MTDKDKKFDLKVRSLLEDAGMEVPAGAWEAVRARIPAKAAKKAAPWWAGAGLAAAAAATALALVLGGTLRRGPSDVPQDAIRMAEATQTVETPAVEGPAAEAPVLSEETAPSRQPSVRLLAQAAPVPVTSVPDEGRRSGTETAEAAGIESATTKSTPSQGTVATTPGEQASTSPSRTSDTKKETWSDPFARMAYEDAHRKRVPAPSLQLNGLVGTNDKATATLRSRMMAAPARVKSESGASADIVEEGKSVYGIPVSFGIGAKFYLSERWALGTGINFTLLNRSFPGYCSVGVEILRPSNSNIKHTVQYLGIPVNLYYDFVSGKRLKMYAFAGGSVEKGISQKYTIPAPWFLVGGDSVTSVPSRVWKQKVPGLQGSAALGAGVEMKLSDHLGLYLDPSARYYFGANQPKSIRTQQDVMFNLELGIRFDL